MMKKLLYLAPVLDNSLDGLLSSIFLDEINNIENLKIDHIPIYLNNEHHKNIQYSIKDLKFDYDTLIQYAPLDYLISSSIVTNSIIIPICGYVDSTIINKLRYCSFSKILVNNKYHLDHFKKVFGNKVIQYKTKLFLEKFDKANKKYNLNLYNHTNKFYIVASYANEKYLIDKIITAFLLAFRNASDNSLILFVTSSDEATRLNQTVAEITKNLSIINGLSQIQIIPFSYSLEQLEIIHNTGDTYISTWLSTNEDTSLAQKYNNKIIYISRTPSIPIPNIVDMNIDQLENSPITIDIMKDMLASINNKPKYFSTDTKCIKDILK